MDIHEYPAKQLLSKFGVNIPAGEVIYQKMPQNIKKLEKFNQN